MHKLVLRTILLFLLVSLLGQALPTNIVLARTIDEIQDDIKDQKKALAGVKGDLSDAESLLAALNSTLNNAQGEIPKLKVQIKTLKAEIELNKLQLQFLDEDKDLKDLELEQREVRQEFAVNNAYRNWKANSNFNGMLAASGVDKIKSRMYQAQVLAIEQQGIEGLTGEIIILSGEIVDFKESTESLEQQNKKLKRRKQELEQQLAYLSGSIQTTNTQVAGLRTEAAVLKSTLSQLSSEQKALQDYQAWLLGQAGNGGTNTVASGDIYFTGRGRDLTQGHGVGMSQYGARGAALQGVSGEDILEFYYPGARVTTYNESTKISVKYCARSTAQPGAPALDPYQDGCHNGRTPVIKRVLLNDYLAGLGEMPESWPIQARRAQMIAARTYALRYTNNGDPSYPICLTTYCQVSYFKNGDLNEMDIVESTQGKVVTYQGSLIEALYSADNNQGDPSGDPSKSGGTADHDTRFQNLYGQPTGSRPYLKSVNDNKYAKNSRLHWSYYCPGSPCGLWSWRTNGYSYSDIDRVLSQVNRNNNFASIRAPINAIRRDIGKVVDLNFVRDGSGRVKKVRLTGDTGVTRTIGGWYFKSLWNSWIYDERPTGQLDYIYSLTYFQITK